MTFSVTPAISCGDFDFTCFGEGYLPVLLPTFEGSRGKYPRDFTVADCDLAEARSFLTLHGWTESPIDRDVVDSDDGDDGHEIDDRDDRDGGLHCGGSHDGEE